MIYGLLTGILLAAAVTFFCNPRAPVTTLSDNSELNAARDMIRLIAWNAFVVAFCTLIGLLIRGS